jgi:ATP-binding cassette subfamily B protein/subfamily B ATP-binding cassette protein MsbA
MTTMRKYQSLLRYALRQWPRLLVLITLNALTAAVAALQPWPMKLLVDYALGHGTHPAHPGTLLHQLTQGTTPSGLVIIAAGATLALFAVNSVLSTGLAWNWAVAGRRMVYDVAADLFRQLQRLSLLFHSRRTVGDALTRLTGDTWSVYTLTNAVLVGPAQQLFTLVTVGLVAWKLDAGLTVLSLTVIPFLGASARFFGQRLKRRSRLSREAQARLLSFVHQTLTALPVVQAFGAEARNNQQFRRFAANEKARLRRDNLMKNGFRTINGLITTLGMGIILYAGGQRVLSGALSVGSLLVFLAYLRTTQRALTGLLESYGTLQSLEASLDRVFEILNAEERVKEVPGAKPLSPRAPGEAAHVRLEGVTFGYEPERPVLTDVWLEARPGETLALVGVTGAGKSTLVSLVPRFFDPWAGRVLVDGVDVREVQLRSLRSEIALVLQESFILPLSVAENIAYGRPSASRAEVEAAAHAANAHGFIERLPQGYDTVVGERGANLSGGERQRLAIARAFLRDAPILILDEPTSALDAGTEALVLGALERLMRGRTVLVIAHRLSTARRASRIAVLEQGRIVETGSHDELLLAGGAYHRLYNTQLGTRPSGTAA